MGVRKPAAMHARAAATRVIMRTGGPCVPAVSSKHSTHVTSMSDGPHRKLAPPLALNVHTIDHECATQSLNVHHARALARALRAATQLVTRTRSDSLYGGL